MNKKISLKIISGTLLCTMCAYTVPVFAYTKDETVYSKLDASGNSYNTIVSTHIQNTDKDMLLNDLSDLLNIENTKEDKSFKQDGNSLVWQADENDIYYQGESKKDLPIDCTVKYELDGKEIEANQIIGKSGKVKVTLEYTNKDEHVININGKEVKMYTPFIVVAGTIIKNENNKNIEISNGKVVDDGSKSIVMGIAMPGLQESLNVSSSTLKIPNNIEITMDAIDFEFNNIVSFVTPKVFEESDLENFDKLDELYKKVNTLQDSMNQIKDGAEKLAEGTGVLEEGTNRLKEGTNSACNGANQIKSEVQKATASLSSDKSEALDNKTLNSIGAQAESSATLSDNQKANIGSQAQSTAMQQIQSQKVAIGSQAQALAEQQIQSQKAQIGKQAATVAKQTIESQKAQIGKQAENEVAGLTLTTAEEQKIAGNVKVKLSNNATFNSLTEQEQAIVLQFSQSSAISAAQSTLQTTAKKVAGETAQTTATTIASQVANTTAQTVAEQVAGSVANTTAQTVAEQVAGSVANTTAQTVAQTTATTAAKSAATTTAKEVANQVKQTAQKQVVSQMSALGDGLNELTTGLLTLDSGVSTLQSGASDLNEGANTLSDGISTFNEDGIQKICNYINGDVKDITTRVEKLTDLAKEYKNFTMLNSENEGNVKFVMIIDALKKQENQEVSKEDVVLNKEN